MDLQKQVVSLELAKRLKEICVKQDSLFYWAIPVKEEKFYKDENSKFNNNFSLFYNKQKFGIIDNDLGYLSLPGCGCCEDTVFEFECYSAFTVAELGEFLPKYIKIIFDEDKNGYGVYSASLWIGRIDIEKDDIYEWCLFYGDNHRVNDEKEADARAKILIYLIENGLMKNE